MKRLILVLYCCSVAFLFHANTISEDDKDFVDSEIERLTKYVRSNKNSQTELVGKAWGNLGILHQ